MEDDTKLKEIAGLVTSWRALADRALGGIQEMRPPERTQRLLRVQMLRNCADELEGVLVRKGVSLADFDRWAREGR